MSSNDRRVGLSKSRITMFEQCPKRIWLAVHRPELGNTDDAIRARFATGHEVGELACALLSGGTMVHAKPDLTAALEQTERLLAEPASSPIFEATLQHDGVLVRIDILEPDNRGGWQMAEVKSSTKAKEYHLGDLATQIWIARENGLTISGASIRHLNKGFILTREGDYSGLFSDTEMMAEAEPVIERRPGCVAAIRSILTGSEPDYSPGPHCQKPFACEFSQYCQSGADPGPEWPVTVLPNGAGKRWIEKGVEDLFDVDPGDLTNIVQKRVHQSTVTGIPYHDPAGASVEVAKWKYPRTWLDFETIAFAIPRWLGTRPYQQIPFQFSAHIEQSDGSVAHEKFLLLDGSDPRRACAEALLNMLPPTGAIIAYNASFERTCIRELAMAFPDLCIELEALSDRVVDLLPVTRSCWYHRDQRGSWSLKAVLPTIDASLDYSMLEVKDGGNAQDAYLEATCAGCSVERQGEIAAALKAYCARDTEAMIVLARKLCKS